jgi:signal transduction histidine kinase
MALSEFSQQLIEAHEQERAWIARELHDDVCQRLVGLTIQLKQVSQSLPPDSASLRSTLEDTCSSLNKLGRDIQAISHRLHSSSLEHLGLVAAANGLCRELSEQYAVTIAFTHDRVPLDLSKDVALGMFRVLQEALINGIKHSNGDHFTVTLRGGDVLELEVTDFGVGFDPHAARTRGLGLTSMRERLRLMNGELFIESRPHEGTRIRARVPWGSAGGRG